MPHWDSTKKIQFVSFRLEDAFPPDVAQKLAEEKAEFLAQNPFPWDEKTEDEYDRKFGERIARILDAGYGSCILGNDACRAALAETLLFDDGNAYKLHAFVIMPNHVHVLVELGAGTRISSILRAWKGVSAYKINKILGSSGTLWQADFYDRMLRGERHYLNVLRYIQNNRAPRAFHWFGELLDFIKVADATLWGKSAGANREKFDVRKSAGSADTLVRDQGALVGTAQFADKSVRAPSILQRPSLANAEEEIAGKVREIQRSRSALPAIKIEIAAQWAQDRAGFAFAPEQLAAVKTALAEKFSIITGGPGTGKTTILSALCKILVAKKTIKIKLAAPTGRAAQRMSESTGVPAQTIHRMLNIQRERQKDADEESRELIADGNAPKSEFLDADFVILDEASMLDVRLAARLLSAIKPEAHVVFVGDVNQLPSIGPGNVLSDLIAAGTVPTTRLQAIFRQGARSGIVTTAHNVLCGNVNPPAKILSFSEINPANDIFYFPCATPEECQRKVLTLISQILPRVFGLDSVNDVQILTAMHKGAVGVQMLNAYLQKLLKNQPLAGTETRHFELGDKVIQTRNNYDKNVFNGDMGIVAKIDKTEDEIVVQFDKERVVYTFAEAASELILAYAMTIHKSQGSEFPAVIIPLVKAQWMMLRRNLIYTAITRGRRKVFIVAQDGAYFMAVKNNESSQRTTTLRERMGRE